MGNNAKKKLELHFYHLLFISFFIWKVNSENKMNSIHTSHTYKNIPIGIRSPGCFAHWKHTFPSRSHGQICRSGRVIVRPTLPHLVVHANTLLLLFLLHSNTHRTCMQLIASLLSSKKKSPPTAGKVNAQPFQPLSTKPHSTHTNQWKQNKNEKAFLPPLSPTKALTLLIWR